VGEQRTGGLYDPAEIVTALSNRDDLNSDVFQNGNTFIFGSTTEMSPGQSLTVTMTFDTNDMPVRAHGQGSSGAPLKVVQITSEIVVGIARTGTKKSYTLHNFTFDRVSMRAGGS
jgi:hypothetical protein